MWRKGNLPTQLEKKESEDAQSCPTLCDPMDCSLPAPSSVEFSRQEYWSGLPFPSPGDLPDPGIEPMSPTLQADALTSAPPGKPLNTRIQSFRKPPIETQQRFQGRKGSQVERRRGRRRERGGERGGLTDVSCHLQIPRRYGTFPWASREGRTGTRPYQRSEPESKFSAKSR